MRKNPYWLEIEFDNTFVLRFRLLATPITSLWLERMSLRRKYALDDPKRFYGIDSEEKQRSDAEMTLREIIKTINDYQPIIMHQKNFWDQEALNYLHNIFEVYHGLLDQQNTAWWRRAPKTVRKALQDLNIAVHRCETILAGGKPRFVCTWFGMPKEKELTVEQMHSYGELETRWGGVYLNYVEIGKTFSELVNDDDEFISDEAFKPFKHYSADFVVKFYDDYPNLELNEAYFEKNKERFQFLGFESYNDTLLLPLNYRVAQLDSNLSREDVIIALRTRQHVTKVKII